MNEPSPPLRIDLRLILESLADGLAVATVGVAALGLDGPYEVGVPLFIAIALVMVRRLLGQKTNAAITSLGKERDVLTVENTVLAADAPASVKRAAVEAGAALSPPKPPEPSTFAP